MTTNAPVPAILAAILAVQTDIGAVGVAKGRRNQQQGYNFRGIDEMYNALSPLLSKHSLFIVPRMLSRTMEERVSKGGGALFYAVVEAEFDFTSAIDGSKVTVRMFGEAMDTADKATNKAQSAAYKYAVMQTFAIPTEGDNDADATTHEPVGRAQAAQARPQPPAQEPKQDAPQKRRVPRLAPARQAAVVDAGDLMIELFADGKELAAYELFEGFTVNDEKVHLWNYLKNQTELRAAIERYGTADRESSPQPHQGAAA